MTTGAGSQYFGLGYLFAAESVRIVDEEAWYLALTVIESTLLLFRLRACLAIALYDEGLGLLGLVPDQTGCFDFGLTFRLVLHIRGWCSVWTLTGNKLTCLLIPIWI